MAGERRLIENAIGSAAIAESEECKIHGIGLSIKNKLQAIHTNIKNILLP